MPGGGGVIEVSLKGFLNEGYAIAGVYEQNGRGSGAVEGAGDEDGGRMRSHSRPTPGFPASLRSGEARLFFYFTHNSYSC